MRTIRAWMQEPPWPREASPLLHPSALPDRTAVARAANTAAALRLVAEQHAQLAAVLQHQLSRHALEQEIAQLLYRWTQERAQRLLEAGDEPPASDDLLDRIIRRTYLRRKAEQAAAINAEANRRFAEVVAKRARPTPDA